MVVWGLQKGALLQRGVSAGGVGQWAQDGVQQLEQPKGVDGVRAGTYADAHGCEESKAGQGECLQS